MPESRPAQKSRLDGTCTKSGRWPFAQWLHLALVRLQDANMTQAPKHSRHVCAMPCGLQGGGALGDASTPGTPAGSIAASAHGGTYSHVAVAGGAWGRERGTTAATARRRPAGFARRPRKEPSLRRAAHLRTAYRVVDTAHGRAGGTDHARRGASNCAARWRQKPLTSRRNRSRRAGTITGGSSWARRTPKVAARDFPAQLGGGRGAGAVRAL